jgi:KDO2-lipid IV(A) lauroyltransferase
MVNVWLYAIGQWLALHLPLRFSYALAVFFCDIHFIFADKDRLYTLENLRVIFPNKSLHEIKQIRIRMFRNFAKYLVDFFRFPIIDQDYIDRYIKIENRHIVDEALKKGKGAITLTAHIGNWELGGLTIGVLGYSFWAVALPHKNKKINDFFNSRRENKGVHVIPFGKAAKMCLNVLRENKVLALLGDRDFTHEAGVIVELFGKKTYIPKGPAAFALKTGAAIIPGFMLRNPDDTFTLRFEEPIPYTETESVETVSNRVRDLLESYITRYPDQWFMFRRFWIE